MGIHQPGTSSPMSSSFAFDDQVRQWARDLENREAMRSNVSIPIARKAVAARAGVPAGTLENMRRGRVKGLRGWVRDRIQQLIVRELEAEIGKLTHELEMAVWRGAALGSDEIIAAKASLDDARKLIGDVK
jgi:hypothetical protein